MKTVSIKLYSFDELSEKAKQYAINRERENLSRDYIYDDAEKTVDRFNEIFNVKQGRNSWLEFSLSHLDDNILNLKGQRLRTYIINNFWNDLFKGKYFSLWSKTEVSYEHYKDGYPVLKSRHSKVIFDNSCTLTGVCYDHSLLQPMYEFLEWNLRPDYNSYMDLETLIGDCFANLEKDIDSEIEHAESDENISETLRNNEYTFEENGVKRNA